MRPKLAGNADHFRCRRHFEIERLAETLLQPLHIVIDDMAAIFTQMCGDAVGAGGNGELGSLDRIGVASAARVSHGRNMVDIDPEPDG
jgi:hypothetical protein